MGRGTDPSQIICGESRHRLGPVQLNISSVMSRGIDSDQLRVLTQPQPCQTVSISSDESRHRLLSDHMQVMVQTLPCQLVSITSVMSRGLDSSQIISVASRGNTLPSHYVLLL